jgi:hypothetical protein
MIREDSAADDTDQDTYGNWVGLGGYFDGDGTIEVNVRTFTVDIRLAFDENWKPHLDGIRAFLEAHGVTCGAVRKKDGFNTWHLVIAQRASALLLAKKLLRHTVKKRGELIAAIAYMENEITAEELVRRFNNFVRIGERTGKLRRAAPPFTLSEGKEIALHWKGGIGNRTIGNRKKRSTN